MNTFWKAAPWINKALVVMSTLIFVMISVQPLIHPAANAAAQGIAFTSSIGSTLFRVSFAGFPLGCAAFLVYCLLSKHRTLVGLIFSALVLGTLLAVRTFGMEVDSTVPQSMPLVIPESALVVMMLIGIAFEMRLRSHTHRIVTAASTPSLT
jgi:hypothetical protein